MGMSKGTDVFGYVSSAPDFALQYASPHRANTVFSTPTTMLSGHHEISESDIGFFEHTGRLSLSALVHSLPVGRSKYAEIAPSTGNLGDCPVANMFATTSEVAPSYTLSYGFFDAPRGDSDQMYAYLTSDMSNWMANTAAKKPSLQTRPLSTFVLPGSHDAGMFTALTNKDAATLLKDMINNYQSQYKVAEIIGSLAFPGIGRAIAVINGVVQAAAATGISDTPRQALVNLAMTQKDSIATQLALGVRYFDFRPGHDVSFSSQRTDKLRHQHLFIPGYRFDLFLSDVVVFLTSHPGEIVIVGLSSSGFMEEGMKATPQEIQAYIDAATKQTSLVTGTESDFGTSYASLIQQNKRLLFAKCSSLTGCQNSYSDDAYKTTSPAPVLAALKATVNTPATWTVLQLQGTSTATEWGLMQVVTKSDASSPLLGTKAKFDNVTYKWLANPATAS
ncbi:hypothetical protein As57867_006083, partial [Aphanomyces stellatus]